MIRGIPLPPLFVRGQGDTLAQSTMTAEVPVQLNIADWFLDARVREGRGDRTALATDAGRLSYREVQAWVLAI